MKAGTPPERVAAEGITLCKSVRCPLRQKCDRWSAGEFQERECTFYVRDPCNLQTGKCTFFLARVSRKAEEV